MATQQVYLIRHGETPWSLGGQHTGLTDIPLTEDGRQAAKRLAPVLAGITFALILLSPLRRARDTCELAGLSGRAEVARDLMEWNYGDYEGLTPNEIEAKSPGWVIFRTVAQAAKARSRWGHGPTASSRGSARRRVTSRFSGTAISSAYLPPAGSAFRPPRVVVSFWVRRPLAS